MTTREILKQTGLTDAQIDALDANVLKGFDSVLTTATTAEQHAATEKAEAAEKLRLQQDLYDREIAPALNNWGSEKTNLEAEMAFLRKQLEGAKTNGFLPKDAPVTQPQDPQTGRFVAGGNPVPGSPGFTAAQGLEAISNATWFIQEHQRLYGAPPPDDFMTLVKEATDNRRQFKDYVDIKYKFADKRKELVQAAKDKERADIVKEVEARKDKEWAEKIGNNPNVRQGQPSQFDKVAAGIKAGQLKDPLTMSPEQRRNQTRQVIQKEIADTVSQGNA